jgi:hypothetical protein
MGTTSPLSQQLKNITSYNTFQPPYSPILERFELVVVEVFESEPVMAETLLACFYIHIPFHLKFYYSLFVIEGINTFINIFKVKDL